MPSKTILAGQAQSGNLTISHDPQSPADLVISDVRDYLVTNYVRPAPGDFFPGIVNPNDGATLYATYRLVDIQVIDEQYERRVWRLTTGTINAEKTFDPETDAAMTIYSQVVPYGTSPIPLSGATYNGQYVIESDVKPINNVISRSVWTAIDLPDDIIEDIPTGFSFPAQFEFLSGWLIPPLCTIPGPYPGVTHTLTQQRTASKPAVRTKSYSLGRPSVSNTWTVTSPGSADRFFGIGSNTIHNAIFIEETCGAGTQTVEDLPESTPNSYDPSDTLLIQTGTRKWRGNLYEKFELEVTETP